MYNDYNMNSLKNPNFLLFMCVFFTKGEIYVAPGAKLDREELRELDIQVTAFDSPLDAVVRRFSTVTVSFNNENLSHTNVFQ